jgi:3D-(3,5/4)-trihydroxycyclohexane-1,2-dione acylhydrolase (decyclizing)
VQTQAFDCPEEFLHPATLRLRRPEPDALEFERALATLTAAKRPLIVVGGGVLYSRAGDALAAFAKRCGIPFGESQAGKGSLAWDHSLNLGSIGVTGSPAANELAREADLIVGVGTRLQDFTTGSHTLFGHVKLLSLNVQGFDAHKRRGQSLVCDARVGLTRLADAVRDWRADAAWTDRAKTAATLWNKRVTELTTAIPKDTLPYDAEVIGAVRESAADSPSRDIAVCASGTLPAELHKLWRSGKPGGYHMEYGYSCMGYEIAGALGVKMARPQAEVIAMVGDGSYMMMNSELATSVMLGRKLIVVVLDNRGYGCIQRLQLASGGTRFNNMLENCVPEGGSDVHIDFAAHARSMGATAVHVASVAELKTAMRDARASATTQVIVIDTTHTRTTDDGGWWWEVAIPEISQRREVADARARYLDGKRLQRI